MDLLDFCCLLALSSGVFFLFLFLFYSMFKGSSDEEISCLKYLFAVHFLGKYPSFLDNARAETHGLGAV